MPPSARGQIVDAAVADVGEVHPARREPAQAQRRAHAGALLVAAAEKHQRAVDLVEEFLQHVGAAGFQPERRLLERARQQARDFFHGDAAGEFAGHRAAHAVAHREDEIRQFRRGRRRILPR